MRSAEEYYNQYTEMTGMDMDDFVQVLNEARSEVISITQDETINACLQQVEKYNTGKELTPVVTAIINSIKQLKK